MNIGIVGENSYIGKAFSVLLRTADIFHFNFINSRNNAWKESDFSKIHSILHVAGIAHVSTDPNMENLYYSINRDLPIQVAVKAKKEGVRQFVFLSSMIVYGDETNLRISQNITVETEANPTNFYGKSKLEAEQALLVLADENFTVSIIRTPMVYGQKCKGNFPLLIQLAKKVPIFPDIDNKRSMIYIDNLCAYISLCITNKTTGIFYPQNSEYVSTKAIIEQAAINLGKKIYFTKIFNPLIYLLSKRIGLINKVFGSKTYDKSLSPNLEQYNLYTFEESIQRYFEIPNRMAT